jgi:hypothetical protein
MKTSVYRVTAVEVKAHMDPCFTLISGYLTVAVYRVTAVEVKAYMDPCFTLISGWLTVDLVKLVPLHDS